MERQGEELFVSSLGCAPMVFIGLGGSGAEVVARLKDMIRQQFPDPNSPAYKSFQFLCIDTAQFSQLPVSAQRVLDEDEEYLFLGREVNPRSYVAEMLRHRDLEATRDLLMWLGDPPPEEVLRQLPEAATGWGAERFRLAGRIFLYYHRKEVEGRLTRKFLEASNAQIQVEAGGGGLGDNGLRVYLVSGTCGGTGSAIFFDVLYMVNRIIAPNRTAWSPEIHAVLLLPDYHISLHEVTRPTLVPYYKANGWAFFSELSYILRNPDEFNLLAFDRISGKRDQGLGLQTVVRPLDYVWLFDATIPGFGTHGTNNPSDFYAYVAKAFYHQLATTFVRVEGGQEGKAIAGSLRASLANFNQRRYERDRMGVPKLFCSVGYGEIRYPALMIYHYLRHRFGRWFLEEVALKEPDPTAVKKVAEELFQQVMRDILVPLEEKLKKLADLQVEDSVPPLSSFQKLGSNEIDEAKVTADALTQVVQAAKGGLERLKRDMVKCFQGELERLKGRFEELVWGEVATASGYRGYVVTQRVLEELDDLLEDRGAKYGREFDEGYRKSLEQLEALADPTRLEGIVNPGGFGKEKRREQGLQSFLAEVRNAFQRAAKAMEASLLRELIRHIAGDPGDRVPVLNVYDPDTGEVVGHSGPTKAILDEIEDDYVWHIVQQLRGLLDQYSDKRLKESLWAYEGKSPTSQYLPEFKTLEELSQHVEGEKLLAVTDSVSRDELLKRFTMEFSHTDLKAGGEPLRRKFDLFVTREVSERWKGRIGKDILDSLRTLRESDRKDKLETLEKASGVPLTLDPPLRTDDREEIIVSIGSNDFPGAKALLSHLGNVCQCPTGKEELAVIRSAFAIPLERVQSIKNLYASYKHRDMQKNWPHINVQFHEAGPPGFEEAFDEALETFIIIRALDRKLEEAEKERRVDDLLKEWGISYSSSPLSPPFRFVVRVERTAGSSLMSSRIWAYEANEFEWVESTRQWRIRDKRITLLEGKSAYYLPMAYVRHDSVVQNHRRVVDQIDRGILRKLCEEYTEKVLRPAIEDIKKRVEASKTPYDREANEMLSRWFGRLFYVAERIRPKDRDLGPEPEI